MSSFPKTGSHSKTEQCRLSLLENEEDTSSVHEKADLNDGVSCSGQSSKTETKTNYRNDIIAPVWKPKVPPPPSHPPLESRRPFNKIFRFLVSTGLTTLFYTGLPILSSLFVVCGLFPRLFVKVMLRFCDGGKFQLLPVSRTFGSRGANHHTAIFVCRGHCDIEKIRARLLKAVVEKDASTGVDKFSHLRQRVTTKFGYLCLENRSTNFDIKNHVKHFDIRRKHVALNVDEIISYLESTYAEPFDNYFTAPQWEVLIVPKYVIREKEEGLYPQNREDDENMYAVIFRFHHGVMNWNMLQELLLEGLGKTRGHARSVFCPNSKHVGIWKSLKMKVACPLMGPQAFLRNILKGWSVFAGMKSLQEQGRISFASTKPISLETLEDIRDRTHTSASSILGSCVRISVRNMVLGQNMEFPKTFCVVRTFNTMNNRLPSVDSFKANFQKFRSCLQRLHTSFHAIDMNDAYLSGQRSFNKVMIQLLGFFPSSVSAWLYRTLMKADAVVEIWPASDQPCTLFGGDLLEDVYGWSGVNGIDANFKFTVTSYCGRIRANVVGKLGQLSGGMVDARILSDEFEVEYEHLASAVALYPQQLYLSPLISDSN